MKNNIMYKIGDIVRHYKSNYYQITGFAKHTESLENLIIYRPFNLDNYTASNSTFWARPESMFDGIVDGCCTKRFTLIEQRGNEPC